MSHNLDEATHEMSFTIGGETFVVQDVPPEELFGPDAEEEEEGKNGDPKPEKGVLEMLDEQILVFLNEEDEERYLALRARKRGENPVPFWKLREFRDLLWETQSDRPTNPPTPSVAGRGRTARTSEGA